MYVLNSFINKLAIFAATFAVLYFFMWSSLVLNLSLVVLTIILTQLISNILCHVMPRHMLTDLENKAVLITGCDTGFGHELARKLDKLGVMVFAGCLLPDGTGAMALKDSCSERLKVLHLDVTRDDHVQAAVKMITATLKDRNEKLWAVVNNSGISINGEVEWMTTEMYQKIFDVNTIGPVRITSAFLPLLRKSQGRIVIVTSFLGRITFPGLSGYCMSKYAATSFADALRRETMKWSISVHTIEPYFYKTNLTDINNIARDLQRTWDQTSESIRAAYGEEYLEKSMKTASNIVNSGLSNLNEVVDDMIHATVGRNPKICYVPSIIGRFITTAAHAAPVELFDFISYILMPRRVKSS